MVFFGGSTAAERDPLHIGYSEGYLGDMWLYNVSSNTIRFASVCHCLSVFVFVSVSVSVSASLSLSLVSAGR